MDTVNRILKGSLRAHLLPAMATGRHSPQAVRDISSLASDCRDLFQETQAAPWLTEANARLEEVAQRFDAWVSYLGVLAVGNASLDYRLRLSEEIRVMVVDLLLLLERNLIRLISSELDDLLGPLDSLRGGVDRLHRMALAIRKSSTASLASRIKSFSDTHDDEDYFYSLALEIVRLKFPNASTGLCKHLATSIKFRRQSLRYKRRHQVKLQPHPGDHGRLVYQQASTPLPPSVRAPSPTPDVPNPRNPFPAPSNTSASTFIPGAFARHYVPPESTLEPPRRTAPATSVISIGSTVVEHNDLPYPKPPNPPDGQQARCDWCFQTHPAVKYGDKAWWSHHVLRHLELYACLSQACKDPPKLFSKRSEWRDHMRSAHGIRWAEEIYPPVQWCCDIGHEPVYFDKERDMERHLADEHSNTFTPAQYPTVIEQTSLPSSREEHVCPLCDSIPDTVRNLLAGNGKAKAGEQAADARQQAKGAKGPASKRLKVTFEAYTVESSSSEDDSRPQTVTPTQSDLSGRELLCLVELERHVAAHLQNLAFISIRNFDSNEDETGNASSKAGAEHETAQSGSGTSESSKSTPVFEEIASSRRNPSASQQEEDLPPPMQQCWAELLGQSFSTLSTSSQMTPQPPLASGIGDHIRLLALDDARRRKAVPDPDATGSVESRRDDLLKSLCTDEFHDQCDVPYPTENTGRWIESTAEFQKWQDGTTKKLWIHGDTGVGKTYLARNIISRLRDEEEVHVVRCFLDGRLKARNTNHAIFRSTIHQLAAIYPNIWSKTRAWEKLSISPKIRVDLSRARREDGTAVRWEVEDLMILWKDMVSEAAVNGDKGLAIVVDGFDEIPESDQTEFLDCLQECEPKKTGGYGRPNLRVLVLSRWCASLDDKIRGFAAYKIKKSDNEQDIRHTIKKILKGFAKRAKYSESFQNELCNAVAKSAEGTYMWATAIMADIKINMPKRDQLEEQLKQIPRPFAEYFDGVIGKIESRRDSSWDTTRNVLLWVVFGLEPLGPQELNAALALTKICQNPPKEPINAELIGKWMSNPNTFKARLAMACGQLLSISTTNHVTTVHWTLANYLNTTPKRFEEWGWEMPNHKRFYRSPKDAHAKLGYICAEYLCMPSFEDAGELYQRADNGAEWEIKVEGRIMNHQLVRYAALCWSQHFRAAGAAGGHDGSSGYRDIRDPTKGLCVSWSEVWWYFRKWRTFPFPETLEGLQRLLLEAETAGNSLVPPTEGQRGRELIQPTRQSAGQSAGQSTGQSTKECTKKEPFVPIVEEQPAEEKQPGVEHRLEKYHQPGLKDQLLLKQQPAEREPAEKHPPALEDQTISETQPAAESEERQLALGKHLMKEDLPPAESLLPAAEDRFPAKDLPPTESLSLAAKEKKLQLPTGYQPLEEDQPPSGKQPVKQEQLKGSQPPEENHPASGNQPLSEGRASSDNQLATEEQPRTSESQHPMRDRPRPKNNPGGGRELLRSRGTRHTFIPSLSPLMDVIETLNPSVTDGGGPAIPALHAQRPRSNSPARQNSGGLRGQTPHSPSQDHGIAEERESVGDTTSTSDTGPSSSDTGLTSSYVGSEGSDSYLLPPIRPHSPLRTSHEQGSPRTTSHEQHPSRTTSHKQHPRRRTWVERLFNL
ncbi:hypothetical protein RB601_001807 [Gaeumannomyces tritici]